MPPILVSRLGLGLGSWAKALMVPISTIRHLASHPQAAELFRFIFLGTIVAAGRQVGHWISDLAYDCAYHCVTGTL
jgi:hypothetical protein